MLSSCARKTNFKVPLNGEEFLENLSDHQLLQNDYHRAGSDHGEALYLPLTKSLSCLSECPQRSASSGRAQRPLSLAFLPTFLRASRAQQLCCVAEAYRAVHYAHTGSRIVPLSVTLWKGGWGPSGPDLGKPRAAVTNGTHRRRTITSIHDALCLERRKVLKDISFHSRMYHSVLIRWPFKNVVTPF